MGKSGKKRKKGKKIIGEMFNTSYKKSMKNVI